MEIFNISYSHDLKAIVAPNEKMDYLFIFQRVKGAESIKSRKSREYRRQDEGHPCFDLSLITT